MAYSTGHGPAEPISQIREFSAASLLPKLTLPQGCQRPSRNSCRHFNVTGCPGATKTPTRQFNVIPRTPVETARTLSTVIVDISCVIFGDISRSNWQGLGIQSGHGACAGSAVLCTLSGGPVWRIGVMRRHAHALVSWEGRGLRV